MPTRPHTARLIAALLALPCAHALAQSAPPTNPPSTTSTSTDQQKYFVIEHTLVLHDDERDKDLHIRILHPSNHALNTPTIIFSHGYGGSGLNYDPLAQHWATHGYIVILPTHSDAIINPLESNNPKRGQRLKSIRERIQERKANKPAAGFDFSDWYNRPRDISFILDSLDEIEKQTPLNNQAIDRDRIGIGGHSYGAFTSQLINGTDPLGPQDFTDPRATCALLISPQGTGGLFTKDAWDNFQGPALTITGDNDEGREGQPATWRREPYDHSPPNTHTLLWINDAYHNFGGISGQILPLPDQGPENPTHVQIVQNATLTFWDHHLKDQSHYIAQFADILADKLDDQLESDQVTIEHNEP